MSLSGVELEKLYKIKEKLSITYKAAHSDMQKKRLSDYLDKIEQIIEDAENGKVINHSELNIFSGELEDISDDYDVETSDRISYVAKVERLEIAPGCRDSEMNQIYSFLNYFEENFSVPFGPTYLKLDYYLSKKRELFYAHYEGVRHLLKEYVDDYVLLGDLKSNDHIEKYKGRLDQQKKYLLIKISELLHELKDFINEIFRDQENGRKSFFNPKEIYERRFEDSKKTDFEGELLGNILEEIYEYTLDFIEILRMPNFKRNGPNY